MGTGFQKIIFMPAWNIIPGIISHGYPYIITKGLHYGVDTFETQLLFDRTVIGFGQEFAEMVYDTHLFSRKNAVPSFFKNVLFGKGGVQGLDGERHIHRKQLFMDHMHPSKLLQLEKLLVRELEVAVARWEITDRFHFFGEINEVLFRTACKWCGLEVEGKDTERMAKWTAVVVEGAGSIGFRHFQALFARKRMESWLMEQVNGRRQSQNDDGSVLSAVAFYKEQEDTYLPLHTAAVELFNFIRPMQAVSRYIVYALIALEHHPELKQKVREDEEGFADRFVNEVRRFYPFFPFVAATAKEKFVWHGKEWQKGTRVLLDLYATNHDPRLWDSPQLFDPDRFIEKNITPYNLVPQGGGDHFWGHRCAGEWMTKAITKTTVQFLTKKVKYTVPKRHLEVKGKHFPPKTSKNIVVEWVVSENSM